MKFLLILCFSLLSSASPVFLVDAEGNEFDYECLHTDNVLCLFVFSGECVVCNHNTNIWNKISSLQGVMTYGIVWEQSQLSLYSHDQSIRYKILTPASSDDRNRLINELNIDTENAFTIVVYKGKVVLAFNGMLSFDDFIKIKNQIKLIRR